MDVSALTQVQYDVVGRVARVSLNRPRYRNALGRIALEELDVAFETAVADSGVGAIVLRGEGQHFSAGHDLGTPEKLVDDEARPYPEGSRGVFERSWELYIDKGFRWRNLPKPTIAAVQGYCIFGGWMLAAAMDVVFAAEDARFLGNRFQYFSVPWDIGVRRAKEVMFAPRFIDAREAYEYGFATRVLPADELDEHTMDYAARVAQSDEFELRLTKLALNQAQDLQGYTNHILAIHNSQLRGGSQGGQFPSGQRRIAPIDRALDNYEHRRPASERE